LLVFYVNTGRYNGAANSAFAIKQRDRVSLRGSVRHAPKGVGRFIVSGFFSCQASWLWGEHLNDAAEHHGAASLIPYAALAQFCEKTQHGRNNNCTKDCLENSCLFTANDNRDYADNFTTYRKS
jgi:hypothetical protein